MSMFDDTFCTSSWSSIASSSLSSVCALWPLTVTVDDGSIVTSADATGIAPFSSASRTSAKPSGAVRISSRSPASRTSSAPASSATSITLSSSTPLRSTAMRPRLVKR
jgi:hypothetical protein